MAQNSSCQKRTRAYRTEIIPNTATAKRVNRESVQTRAWTLYNLPYYALGYPAPGGKPNGFLHKYSSNIWVRSSRSLYGICTPFLKIYNVLICDRVQNPVFCVVMFPCRIAESYIIYLLGGGYTYFKASIASPCCCALGEKSIRPVHVGAWHLSP